MPLNTSNLIALAIPTLGSGGGGVDEDGFDVGDGMDGGSISGMHCFINQTALLGETLRAPPRFLVKVKSKDCSLILQFFGSLFRSALPQTSMDAHNPFFT